MNLTPEQFAATRKALRAYDPKGTENLTDEHLDGMALSVALAIVTSAPDQGSGGVKKLPTDEMVKIGAEVLRNWWADPLNVLARKAWEAMEAARPKDLRELHPDKPFCRDCGVTLGFYHRKNCLEAKKGGPLVSMIHCEDPPRLTVSVQQPSAAAGDMTPPAEYGPPPGHDFDPKGGGRPPESHFTGASAARAHERAKGLGAQSVSGAYLGNDAGLVRWVASRMVTVYGERPNVDFVMALYNLADRLEGLTGPKTYPQCEKGVPVLDPINAEKPKGRTADEMREAMKKATMDAALQSLRPGESVRVHKDKNGEFFINEGWPAA